MRSTAGEQLARLMGGVGAASFASRLTAPLQTTRTVEVLPRAPLIFVDNFETGDTSEWSLVAP